MLDWMFSALPMLEMTVLMIISMAMIAVAQRLADANDKALIIVTMPTQ